MTKPDFRKEAMEFYGLSEDDCARYVANNGKVRVLSEVLANTYDIGRAYERERCVEICTAMGAMDGTHQGVRKIVADGITDVIRQGGAE